MLVGILMGQGVVWYLAQFYTLFFLQHVLKLDLAHTTMFIMIVTVITLPFYVFFAWLSDRIGRKPIMLAGLLVAAIATFPVFRMLTEAVNPALAQAARNAPVTVIAAPAGCSLQFNLTGTGKYVSSCDIAKAALTNAGVPYRNQTAAEGSFARVHVGIADVASSDGRNLNAADLAAMKKDFAFRLDKALTAAGYPAKADPDAVNTGPHLAAADAPRHCRRSLVCTAGRRPGGAVSHPYSLHGIVFAVPCRRRLVRRISSGNGLRHRGCDGKHLCRTVVSGDYRGVGFCRVPAPTAGNFPPHHCLNADLPICTSFDTYAQL